MRAPWKGELYVQSTPSPNLKNAVDDDGIWIAANCKSEHAEALVHRANAYPKLVEALEQIGNRAHADNCDYVLESEYEYACDCHVEIARAALAPTREEG